jgi:hypothetical protein
MVEKAAVSWSRVLVSVVLAWPMGKAMSSNIPSEGCNEGGVFIGLLVEINVAAEVHA